MFIFKNSLEGELCGETLWQTSHLNCRKRLLFGLEVRLNQHEGPIFLVGLKTLSVAGWLFVQKKAPQSSVCRSWGHLCTTNSEWEICVLFDVSCTVETCVFLVFFSSSPLGLNVSGVNGAILDMPSRKPVWVVLWKGKGQRINQRGFPPDESDFFSPW